MPLSGQQTSNFFSIDNSTVQPLAANAIFTGIWEDVSSCASISFLWRVNQPGVLYLDFSIDTTEVDRIITINTSDLSDGNFVSVGPRGRYFRVRYVNGDLEQTKFRLQTSYSTLPLDEGHVAVGYGIGNRTISTVSRAAVFGQSDGAWQPIKLNSDGSLSTTVSIVPTQTSPKLLTSKLETTSLDEDQIILSYTPTTTLYLSGFSVYVWDVMSSVYTVFGTASLMSDGEKIYTSQITSMNGGKDFVNFGQSLTFEANKEIKLVCTPSGPITNQIWQGNVIGSE